MSDASAGGGTPDAATAPDVARRRRPSTKQIVQAIVTVAIVALIFVGVFPRIADYGEVWKTISAMTMLEIATLLLVASWNLFSYLPVLVSVLPGLTLRQAFVSTEATTAVANTVPAGGAVAVGLTYAMYSSWGFTVGEIVLSVLVSGIWNTFVKLGMPVIAVALLAVYGEASASLLTASLIGVALLVAAVVCFALMLKEERLARAIGSRLGAVVAGAYRLVRRTWDRDWGSAAVDFRRRTIGLLEGRWLMLTIATLVSHLSLFLVLLVCLRHVGVSERDVSTVQAFAAFAFARLISALPITPGGVGVVELGYVAALSVGLPASMRAEVVAATLVFRALTYLLPIPLGIGAWIFWRQNRSWRKEPPESSLSPTGAATAG
jgi:putative heme transporter